MPAALAQRLSGKIRSARPPPARPVAASPAPVVSGSAGADRSPACPCGGGCPRCRAAQAVALARGTGGAALDPATRQFMEPRLHRDFSAVRVHTDGAAHAAARSLDADAFAIGSEVFFARGQYEPGSPTGRQLLAHELTHAAQGRGVAVPETMPEIAPADSAAEREASATSLAVASGATVNPPTQRARGIHLQRPSRRTPPPIITDVDVDQNTPQTVTTRWSDGTQHSGACSTGKGHCCVDDPTAEGGNASVAGSNAANSNCTPIGDFTITTKIPETAGHVKFWNQFHDARSIALHEYSPVDGTPLSHGCVRLHSAMAQEIFNGAVTGRTRVHVRNVARPECDHPALVREWAGDFLTAGSQPPDGDQVDPFLDRRPTRAEIARERHAIAEERSDLRAALGTDDAGLDQAIADTHQGLDLAAVQARIPRCVARRTAEEARVPAAITAGLATATSPVLTAFSRALGRAGSQRIANATVQQAGRDLWTAAVNRAQGSPADTDDRTLYWSRLQLSETIRGWEPAWNRTHSPDITRRAQQQLLDLLEGTSRGRDSASFQNEPDRKHILISGFDPFGFASGGDIRQGNPSGAAVLALDGLPLSAGGVRARVQGVIFPVRFADFDAGIVESFFRPYLTGAEPANLIMTISMGGSKDFELETLAGRRRSSTAPDNAGHSGNPAGSSPPPVIPGTGSGAEFIRTNMLTQHGNVLTPSPALVAMRRSLGRTGPIRGETAVTEIRPGATSATDAPLGPTDPSSLAVTGSGGGYLSNEIFYRVSNLRGQTGASVPVIHLHTPLVDETATATLRDRLIATIRALLEAALPNL